jgi:hypothetical protein
MIQNIPREKILEVVALGPTVPAKIVKQVGGDTMFIGAILSTIITTGKIKVSTLKLGGSPLYYIPEHESKLEEFVEHLNEKDRRTYLLIKDQKVLMDESQDALVRTSLKVIRDFAKPFYIDNSKNSGSKILFWRFYNVSLDQAEIIAQKILDSKKYLDAKSGDVSKQNSSSNNSSTEQILESNIKIPSLDINTGSDYKINPKIDNFKPDSENASHHEVQNTLTQSSSEISSRINSEISSENTLHQNSLKEQVQESSSNLAHQEHHHREHVAHHVKDSKPHKEHAVRPHKEKVIKPKSPIDPNKKEFYEVILGFISSIGLDIISKEKIKKSEYNIILKNHNTNEYIYCKAKDKSSITEADLAPALIFAQNKKMPCLFLSTGELSQKTQAMINNEFSSVMFKKI